MRPLSSCSGCSRHIRLSERRCPFCGVDAAEFMARAGPPRLPSERLGRAALFAFATASVAGSACNEARPEPAAAASVSAVANPTPPPVAVAPPAPSVSAVAHAAPTPTASPVASFTGLGAISSLAAAYGGPGAVYGAPPALSIPRAKVTVGTLAVTGASVPNAQRVVAGMRAGFRNCYQRGLVADPTLSGELTVTIKVAPGGEALQARATAVKNVGADVTSCVEHRAAAASFDAREGASTITFPVTFTTEKTN